MLIKTNGIDSLINTPYEVELLPAIIGRSVLKMGTAIDKEESDSENEIPALYIEPTYTLVNKGDISMNQIIQDAVVSGYARELGYGVYTGAGTSRIKIKQSRNPGGQYEDAATGNAGNGGMGKQFTDYELIGERIY